MNVSTCCLFLINLQGGASVYKIVADTLQVPDRQCNYNNFVRKIPDDDDNIRAKEDDWLLVLESC